jgi:hypothetical protein
MGLKPKAELFHKYFLTSQMMLLACLAIRAYHRKFNKNIEEEEIAENEPAKLPVFEYLMMKLTSSDDQLNTTSSMSEGQSNSNNLN